MQQIKLATVKFRNLLDFRKAIFRNVKMLDLVYSVSGVITVIPVDSLPEIRVGNWESAI